MYPFSCQREHTLTGHQIDPNRTISAGKVDIGAFRTYPENYTPPDAVASEYQSIPLNKIEDFGVHANQYYPLEVQIFKSSLDSELLGLLWNKYWVNTLSQSPLISVSHFRDLPCFVANHVIRIEHTLFPSSPIFTRSWQKRKQLCQTRVHLPQRGTRNRP